MAPYTRIQMRRGCLGSELLSRVVVSLWCCGSGGGSLALVPICKPELRNRMSPAKLGIDFTSAYFLPPHPILLFGISFCPLSCIIMLSRRVLVASRFLRAPRTPQLRYPLAVVQQFRSYADQVVKVPEMAESISEGTLKQWSKQIGDFVEQDEEIATIETDKASLSYPLSTTSASKCAKLICASTD
jgi:hypothetical protein